MNLQLDRIELTEIELPLKYPFETSFGRTTRRRIMIVKALDRSGAFGYGECTAPEDPFYNHETIDTAWIITTNYIAPLLAQARIESAGEVNQALGRIRGNRMAKGGRRGGYLGPGSPPCPGAALETPRRDSTERFPAASLSGCKSLSPRFWKRSRSSLKAVIRESRSRSSRAATSILLKPSGQSIPRSGSWSMRTPLTRLPT